MSYKNKQDRIRSEKEPKIRKVQTKKKQKHKEFDEYMVYSLEDDPSLRKIDPKFLK